MRHPLAAWRAGVRWPAAVLGGVLALILVVVVFEALGWPFLVSPVQQWLGKTLDRRVEFRDESGAHGGVRIHLFGGIRVAASSIEIGAPAWSTAPHMLLARDAHLSLGYFDLWHAWRGEPVHIEGLEAGQLDAALERRADGSASWQFGKKAPADAVAKPEALPTFGRLSPSFSTRGQQHG